MKRAPARVSAPGRSHGRAGGRGGQAPQGALRREGHGTAQPHAAEGLRRRRRAVFGVVALGLAALALVLAFVFQGAGRPAGGNQGSKRLMALKTATGATALVPKPSTLSPLRARIVETAESQIGYRTDPSNTYCNKFSAYWHSGTADCGNSDLSEEWCSDFAAWVWQKAGVPIVYQYIHGDINSSAASFYEWGKAHGTWHPLGSGYVPQPGDVAVYGLNVASLYASHVAVVVGYTPGLRGPVAVNGDGDLTGFSVVEIRADEYFADIHPSSSPLSGYVSPN